jgi:hypothetical protein
MIPWPPADTNSLSENWREGRILSVCGSAAHTQNAFIQYFSDCY